MEGTTEISGNPNPISDSKDEIDVEKLKAEAHAANKVGFFSELWVKTNGTARQIIDRALHRTSGVRIEPNDKVQPPK